MSAENKHPLREHKELWRAKLDARCIRADLGTVEARVLELLVSASGVGNDKKPTRLAWPSQDLLALRARVTRERVNRAIKALKSAGLIAVEYRHSGRVRYAAYVVADTFADADPYAAFREMVDAGFKNDQWREDRRGRVGDDVVPGDTVSLDDVIVGHTVKFHDVIVGHTVSLDDVIVEPRRCDRRHSDDVIVDHLKDPSEGSTKGSTQKEEAGSGARAPAAAAKGRPSRVAQSEPDPDPATPAGKLLATILAHPQLAPIVRAPADLARELTDPDVYAGLDAVAEVKKAGAWLRRNPTNAKKSGAKFLANWFNRAMGDLRTTTADGYRKRDRLPPVAAAAAAAFDDDPDGSKALLAHGAGGGT